MQTITEPITDEIATLPLPNERLYRLIIIPLGQDVSRSTRTEPQLPEWMHSLAAIYRRSDFKELELKLGNTVYFLFPVVEQQILERGQLV